MFIKFVLNTSLILEGLMCIICCCYSRLGRLGPYILYGPCLVSSTRVSNLRYRWVTKGSKPLTNFWFLKKEIYLRTNIGILRTTLCRVLYHSYFVSV